MIEQDIKIIVLPLVKDISQVVRRDINSRLYEGVFQWTQNQKDNFVGRVYDFGEILKIGLDDWRGIRIKFKFLDNTVRNISVKCLFRRILDR